MMSFYCVVHPMTSFFSSPRWRHCIFHKAVKKALIFQLIFSRLLKIWKWHHSRHYLSIYTSLPTYLFQTCVFLKWMGGGLKSVRKNLWLSFAQLEKNVPMFLLRKDQWNVYRGPAHSGGVDEVQREPHPEPFPVGWSADTRSRFYESPFWRKRFRTILSMNSGQYIIRRYI
jgi:hypothetical protein